MSAGLEPAPPIRTYTAFISYRHADNKEEGRRWAEWLHQAIETYEVPADLIGKPNLRGEPIPAGLYPVFRDEEELPADADLSDNIRRALQNSASLIVLCSPGACESRFVADEIRIFKELGKSDRILALLLDGEPNASVDPVKQELGQRECLPEPLRFGVGHEEGSVDWSQRCEPIAADVRPEGRAGQGYTSASAYRLSLEKAGTPPRDARRLATAYEERLNLARLKIIAGLLHVPLGQLRDRDAAYRIRKARRRQLLATAVAVMAIVLTGFALWQRNEARKQAEIAVAVNDFLRDDLLLQAGSRAQADSGATADPNLTVREALDRASKGIGKRFRTQPFVEAAIRETIGSAYLDLGMAREALPHFQRTVELRSKHLGPEHAGTLEARHYLAWALDEQGRYAEAEKEHRAVLAVRARVLGPEHSDTLHTRTHLGLALRSQYKHAEAEKEFRAVMAIEERVLGRDAPGTQTARENLAGALAGQRKFAEAEQEFRAVLAIEERVRGPEHPDTLMSRINVANTLGQQQKYSEAEKEYRTVLAIQERVFGPRHPEVLMTCINLTSALAWQKKLEEALGFARRARDGFTETLGKDHPYTKVAQGKCSMIEGAMTIMNLGNALKGGKP